MSVQKIGTKTYQRFLNDLKQRLTAARYEAGRAVNTELILPYHHIGKEILGSQQEHGWRAKVIDQLSHDLRTTFSEMKGFSPRNLKYMPKFAQEYPEIEFVQEVLAQLSWYDHATLLDQISNGEMNFYLSAVDDLIKSPHDQASIGLILYKSKNNVLAKYALRDMATPIGLPQYQLNHALPKKLSVALLSIEVLEAELSKNIS